MVLDLYNKPLAHVLYYVVFFSLIHVAFYVLHTLEFVCGQSRGFLHESYIYLQSHMITQRWKSWQNCVYQCSGPSSNMFAGSVIFNQLLDYTTHTILNEINSPGRPTQDFRSHDRNMCAVFFLDANFFLR